MPDETKNDLRQRDRWGNVISFPPVGELRAVRFSTVAVMQKEAMISETANICGSVNARVRCFPPGRSDALLLESMFKRCLR